MVRRVLILGGIVLLIAAGRLFYVRNHPLTVVPAAVRAEGPRLLRPLLHHHPIPLAVGANHLAVPVTVDRAVPHQSLATSIGVALADQTPTHFVIPPADLASVPAAARPLTARLVGMRGTVTGLAGQALSGSPLHGQATVSATITLNGRPYPVTGVFTITDGAITGVSHLAMTAP
jgi:hypothetical protein